MFFIYVIETEAKKKISEIELMHAFAWICTKLCKYQRKRKLNAKVNEPCTAKINQIDWAKVTREAKENVKMWQR